MTVIIVILIMGSLISLLMLKSEKKKKQINEEMKKPILDYVIIDCETTGLNPKSNRIIEIAALKVSNGEVVDRFSTLINPQKNVTRKITQMTGITNEMLMDAPFEEDVIVDFINFIDGNVIIGYNVNFDLNFLKETLNRMNRVIGIVHYVDMLKIARKRVEGVDDYRLETVVKKINPDFQQSHRALDDCSATKIIVNALKPFWRDVENSYY